MIYRMQCARNGCDHVLVWDRDDNGPGRCSVCGCGMWTVLSVDGAYERRAPVRYPQRVHSTRERPCDCWRCVPLGGLGRKISLLISGRWFA